MKFPRYSFVLIATSLPTWIVSAQNNSHNGIGTDNVTYPLTFKPRAFFDALNSNCQFIADCLEGVPLDPKNSSKARFSIAQIYGECLATQYGNLFACSQPFESLKFLPVEAFPAMYHTKHNPDTHNSSIPVWKNATLPEIPLKNGTQKLPSIVPIMEKACQFDYDSVANSTCCNGYSTSSVKACGKISFNLLACSLQSVRTYVGCTAKQDPDIEKCVVQTAKRINFVPIGFQVDSNGNTCPTPTETISHLTRVTIVDFIVFLLIDNPSFWIRLFRRFVQKKPIKVRSRTFRFSNLGFWTTIAKDICENVVLVGIVLQRQGYQIDLLKTFVLFSIRPRGAVFHALLGYIDGGWGPDGMMDMIAQILLSIFGGYMALFGAIGANHTLDPSRPIWWKTYLAGGAMASIVTDFLLLYVSVSFIALAFICCGGLVVLAYLITIPAVLAWMMLIVAPFKEIRIILKNIFNMLRRRSRYGDPSPVFTFLNPIFAVWYQITMFISLVLCVGCWMFWNGFLRLSGELYCPQDLSFVDLTMIGFYAASVVVRKILCFLMGEKATLEEDIGGAFPLEELKG
ncbi:hypothetical protein BCR34DRAFT_602554 [Clohesyomyces aquaticus]|uniref:Uncharacterized protein n=1 Tax=Clohesyomyces aquaticus TaxID=1231657 RepID=A0A1Y1ZHW1_9PLEO|nr:hypothetical protein BCR34DRAFT_602554 [Clohesyomyces aquaticus]